MDLVDAPRLMTDGWIWMDGRRKGAGVEGGSKGCWEGARDGVRKNWEYS